MGKDRKHFDSYKDQTRIKHEILERYVRVFFNILKKHHARLNFIDGFAGPGRYNNDGESVPGSPIRILNVAACDPELTPAVQAIFVEHDPVLFARLEAAVAEVKKKNPGLNAPICVCGTFKEVVGDLLAVVEGRLAPTFLFVDPCGLAGMDLQTIRALMKHPRCEVFVFYNLDGVRRVAGLSNATDYLGEILGSKQRAEDLVAQWRQTTDVSERGELLLEAFMVAMREELQLEYVTEFRFESEDRRITSHYLIHASRHPLGFALMKDVMYGVGRNFCGDRGREFVKASLTTPALFDQLARAKVEVLTALSSGPMRVKWFYEELPASPKNDGCKSEYRRALLELEEEGKIEVRATANGSPVPAAMRPPRKGPTLADWMFVAIRQ